MTSTRLGRSPITWRQHPSMTRNSGNGQKNTEAYLNLGGEHKIIMLDMARNVKRVFKLDGPK